MDEGDIEVGLPISVDQCSCHNVRIPAQMPSQVMLGDTAPNCHF